MQQATPPTGTDRTVSKNPEADEAIKALRAVAGTVKLLGDQVCELETDNGKLETQRDEARDKAEENERTLADVRAVEETVEKLIDAIHDHRRGMIDLEELYTLADDEARVR